MIKGRYRITGTKKGAVVSSTGWIENLVVLNADHGLNLLLQALGNMTDFPVAITKAKMGTGNTAPASGNTDLVTPTVDNILIATRSFTGANILTLKFFAPDADVPDDTYKEFGIYAGLQLFARSLIIGTYVKATGVDTTVEYELEATN